MWQAENQKFKELSLLFSYPEQIPDSKSLMKLFKDRKYPSVPSLVELQNQYVQLFINAMPEVPCPPYGSIYLEGSCMGKTSVSMQKLYRKYGFETDEMPDHIAVELEFLYYLGQLTHQEEKADEDFVFLLNHIRSWAPAFFDRIGKYDKNGFYRAIAQSAKKILLSHTNTDLN